MQTSRRARRSASLGLVCLIFASLLVPAPALAANRSTAFDTGVPGDFDARTGRVLFGPPRRGLAAARLRIAAA